MIIIRKPLYAIRYTLYAIFVSLAITYFSEYCYSETPVNIRVCVAGDEDKILLSVKGPYRIEALNSDFLLDKGSSLKMEHVTPTNSGLIIGKNEFKIYGIRIIPKRDATIFINRMHLRGIVDIIRTENLKLMVVNHLDVEKYLYGVLYHEIPHYWPMEVLKTQAVAARTFAFYRKKLMRDKDYDVTSDIYSQVYGGKASEYWRATRAVNSTKGSILTYKGDVLPAYYHAICGGYTEDAQVVFGIDSPPLKGRECPYCSSARGMHWKAMFSYKQMEERLNKYGIKVKGLNYIVEGRRNKSGRLESVKIRDINGVKEIEGYKFRLALEPNMIKSANFTIRITSKGIIFRGIGWGHGVGMCQWGAFGMAKRRFNYKQILEFYYPGAEVSKIPSEL